MATIYLNRKGEFYRLLNIYILSIRLIKYDFFRQREREKARERMRARRNDLSYRELEREKDRIRRNRVRHTNPEQRQKERERDRTHKRLNRTLLEKEGVSCDTGSLDFEAITVSDFDIVDHEVEIEEVNIT